MKFPFLFKATEITPAAAPSWPWASCAASPKTLSFRATTTEIANTTPSISDEIPAVIRGIRSDRLFFEPGKTNSILEEAKTIESSNHVTETVAVMEIDSHDPFLDYRVSMAEMVEAHHGLRNWAYFEDLLECYLRVNDKCNHGYIVEAFTDLLIHLPAIDAHCSASSTATHYSFTSSSSSRNYSSVSPCLSSLDCSSSSFLFNG